ncbi:hypothetical protein BJY00DRAFT_321408 [Aspergillus carlsbadensis]|nr:hypothetical protein BJY00DRAFT_321408 [Aspergillus carlsbadensis]
MHDVVLDECLVLSGDEYQALSHYQDTFISDRVLKTPRWSMFGCILRSVAHIPMAMHLLIAIASMDLNQRSPRPAISLNVTRTHFRKGSEMLIQRMNVDNAPDHFSTLSSWLFLYLCMTHRDILNKRAIDKLSMAIANYIQRYDLDRLSAAITSKEQSLAPARPDTHPPTESGLIGRLLLFIASEDIRMGFEQCGGHLAKRLFSNEYVYWRIYSHQRYILERYWGEEYPEYEVVHDVETAAAMELGHKVGLLVHRINEVSRDVSEGADRRDFEIEKGIVEIETEYSSIFRLTRSATPRSPLLRVAEAAVLSFYFVQLYYFRLTVGEGAQPSPPHIMLMLAELMNLAHRALSEQHDWGHGIFDLPLFMAAVETRDQIHVEWILPRITAMRFRTAVGQVLFLQDQTGSRLSIARIKRILEGPSISGHVGIQ